MKIKIPTIRKPAHQTRFVGFRASSKLARQIKQVSKKNSVSVSDLLRYVTERFVNEELSKSK